MNKQPNRIRRTHKTSRVRHFILDKRGNVFMITAFALVPMMTAVGAGVDYTRAARLQTQLQSLADSAALSTVVTPTMKNAYTQYRSYYVAQGSLPTDVSTVTETVNGTQISVVQNDETSGSNTYNAQVTTLAAKGQAAVTMASAKANGNVGTALVKITDTPVTTSSGPISLNRQTVVTFTGTSTNVFGSFLGNPTTTVTGTATAVSNTAPNIDFYLMMDTSPSMALPTTSTGFSQMVQATKNAVTNVWVPSDEVAAGAAPNGCAFSCHQSAAGSHDNMITYQTSTTANRTTWFLTAPSGQTNHGEGNYTLNTNYITTDYYNYAKATGIPLRIDAEIYAAQKLTTILPSYSTANGVTYRMSLSQFDVAWKNIDALSSNWSTISTDAAGISLYQPTSNNNDSNGVGNNDQDTHFIDALNAISPIGVGTGTGTVGGTGILPKKGGTGTTVTGDTPVPYLFIVTDGMRDEAVSGNRVMGPISLTQCTAIKNSGTRIAVLYTKYLPDATSTNQWSVDNVITYLVRTFTTTAPSTYTTDATSDQLATALKSCSSDSTNLFIQVSTDEDISAALQTLFAAAIADAHLLR